MTTDLPLTDLGTPGVERLALRTPTLPPATHTNTYLVGDSDFVVIEPASPYGPEQRALDTLVRDRVARGHRLLAIALTHHHVDHVGGAAALRKAFGAPLLAHSRTREKLRGTIEIDTLLDEGDPAMGSVGLDVIHTPGHAPGHLCFRHRTHRWIIAGDMIASVGTILIDPADDGDMDDYLRELERLRAMSPTVLLPAHGDPIERPDARLGFYIQHRLDRELKVLAAVGDSVTELSSIVATAYSDTPPTLWPLAARSARAHLERLCKHRKIARADGPDRWLAVLEPG